MKSNLLHLVLSISVMTLFFTNCEDINNDNDVSPEDSAAAIVLVSNANASLLPLLGGLLAADPDSAQTILNSIDLSEAQDFYLQASDLDWRNSDAHLGLGLTNLLILSQNTMMNDIFGSSVKVYSPFRDASVLSNPVGYGFGLPLSIPRVNGMIATYFETPLSFARLQFESLDIFNEFQAQINEVFLPMVNAGLASLDSIDDNSDFEFTLGTGIQLDLVDIFAMETSLFGLQGFFKTLTAYNYELNTSDSAAIIAGLTPGSTFGTLNSDGATLLSEAHASAWSATDRAVLVQGMIDAEITELSHLFVDFTQSQSSQIQTALVAIRDALTGATNVEYAYAGERGDIVGGSASIDISQFYINPVVDTKTLLPDYTMGASTASNYNRVTLTQQINFVESQVLIAGLNNTPISVNIEYNESTSDTSALVTLGFLTFNLMTANPSDIPVAVLDLWAEFQTTIEDYSDELYNFPEISFQWSGFITTGSALTIDGNIAIDYLERTGSYIAPDIVWTATSYSDWLGGWTNPTVNGLFPDFLAEDLALLLGVTWE
ncbi:MAG: hypothetical protein HQ506_07410 [Candidatus Marinimicrobia bacterium]|nr:hypothetical protein [Candidatus Neomarinimicrobiota bacterium]